MYLHLFAAVLLFRLTTALAEEECQCSENTTCCMSTMEQRVEGFMDDYKKVLEQSDGPYNLYTMRFVDQPMLDLSWYIRGLLFNESQMHAPLYWIPPVTRAERVEPARNISQLVMQTFRLSMQTIPLSAINPKHLKQYFETLDLFLSGLYDEVGKAMDDAVAKLSEGSAPSYHRRVCTAETLERVGCEFKKASQMFVTTCHRPGPSIVSKIPNKCRNESEVSVPLSACVLDEVLGPMYNYSQLFKTSDVLRIRLFHLIFAYTLCNGPYSRYPQSGPLEGLPDAIAESFNASFERAKLRYWPNSAIITAKALAEQSGRYEYPSESDTKKYNALASQIAEKVDVRWTEFKDPLADHKAFVYYNCDDCDTMADDKWINAETDEQKSAFWWTANDTKGELGIVKQAGVNIVLFRKRGERRCGTHVDSGYDWIKNYSQVIINTVGKLKLEALHKARTKMSGMLLKTLDEELSRANGRPWRASDKGCFRAMLAIRCAYKFVWLELAWKYYPATSDAPHKVDVFNGSFDSRCTRVVFIQ